LLEQHAGIRPQAFVYPLGAHDARVRAAALAAGYRIAFAAQGAPLTHRSDAFALPRYSVEKTTNIYTFARYFRD
jgi:hypothetical protein